MAMAGWFAAAWATLNSASPLANLIEIAGAALAMGSAVYGFMYRRIRHNAGRLADLERDLSDRQTILDRLRLETDTLRAHCGELESGLAQSALSRAEREWRDQNDERAQRELAEWIEREGEPISRILLHRAEWYSQMAAGEFRSSALSAAGALAAAAVVLNPQSPTSTELTADISDYLELEGQPRLAYARALAALEPYVVNGLLFAPGDVQEVLTRVNEVRQLNARGFYNLAIQMVDRAVTIVRRQLGATAIQTLELRVLKASTLAHLGRYPEALDEIVSVLDAQKMKASLTADHPAVLGARYAHAAILTYLRRNDEALAVAFDVAKKYSENPNFGPLNDDTLDGQLLCAQILTQLNRLKEALPIVIDVENKRAAHPMFGKKHPTTLETISLHAELLSLLGRGAEALPLISGVANEMERHAAIGPKHPRTFVAQKVMAQALDSAGKPKEALLTIERAIEGMRAHPALGPNHPFVANCLRVRKHISDRVRYGRCLGCGLPGHSATAN